MQSIEMADSGAVRRPATGVTDLDWEFIKAQLPDGWQELAKKMGLIRPHPAHLGAKITDIEQVLRLELQRVGLESSLRITTARSCAARKLREEDGIATTDPSAPVDIAAPSLHGWERKLGPYLATLHAQMANTGKMFTPELWGGYDLMVADGTIVTRPGAKQPTARILYALHLVDMTIPQQKVTDEHGSEGMRNFEVKAGQLWIADRYYANPEEVAHVKDAGGEVLLRYNRGALPLYDVKDQRLDVMEHVRSVDKPWAMTEWAAWVHPKRHTPILGRLCAMRLPEEEAEQARERLRREYGSKVSPDMLEAADWVIEFVTAPCERIPLEMVFILYRLRWQVELQIKRDKSVGGMDKLPNFRDDTIATWLHAKLLLQQLVRKIVSPAVVLLPEPPAPPSAPPPPVAPDAVDAAACHAGCGGTRGPRASYARDRRRDVAHHRPRPPVPPRCPEPHCPA
jgi:Transposase DDE domain